MKEVTLVNNNKITNPKTETPTGITMNDKDYLTCLLTILKELSKNYCQAMTEASNEHLYKSYLSIFSEISTLQRETYELMFQNGWYQLESADTTKIVEKYNNLSTEYQDLSVN